MRARQSTAYIRRRRAITPQTNFSFRPLRLTFSTTLATSAAVRGVHSPGGGALSHGPVSLTSPRMRFSGHCTAPLDPSWSRVSFALDTLRTDRDGARCVRAYYVNPVYQRPVGATTHLLSAITITNTRDARLSYPCFMRRSTTLLGTLFVGRHRERTTR